MRRDRRPDREDAVFPPEAPGAQAFFWISIIAMVVIPVLILAIIAG